MVEVFSRESVRNTSYQVFVDNPPAWNPSKSQFASNLKKQTLTSTTSRAE